MNSGEVSEGAGLGGGWAGIPKATEGCCPSEATGTPLYNVEMSNVEMASFPIQNAYRHPKWDATNRRLEYACPKISGQQSKRTT